MPRTKPLWCRCFTVLSFFLTALLGSMTIDKPDLVLGFSPLPMGLSACIISLWHRVPFLFDIQDVFPDSAVSAGLIRSPRLARFLEASEKRLYRHSDHIAIIGEVFRQKLIARGVPESKVTVIPNWADANFIVPAPKHNAFRRSLGLKDEFLVLYSGNMGYACDLDTVLDAAALVKDDSGIQFLLVGEGARKADAEEKARALKLHNIRFLPFQPRNEFPQVLAAADACLVTLNKKSAEFSLPGKVYSMMAAGRPILAVMEPINDIYPMVEREKLGAAVRPGDAEALASAIRTMKASPTETQAAGQRARKFMEQHFTVEACVGQFEKLMCEMVARGKN